MNNNKLIAEFMGWDIESPTTIPSNLHLSNLELDNDEVLEYKYHTSWDWLMPVVEKIGDENLLSIDIDIVYDRVVEFIKEHNRTNDYNKVTYYDGQ